MLRTECHVCANLSQSSRGEDGLQFCSGNKLLFRLTLEDQKSVEAGREREREGHRRSGGQGYWGRAHDISLCVSLGSG